MTLIPDAVYWPATAAYQPIMADQNDDIARRDRVWDATIRALAMSPASIRTSDVSRLIETEISDRTIRRVMNSMRAMGWLQRDTDGSHDWFPGPRAREHLAVYHLGQDRPPGAEDLDRVLEDTSAPSLDDSTVEQIDEYVLSLDIPGAGDRAAERRNAIRLVIADICREGQAQVSDLKARFYPEQAAGYQTRDGWWTNLIYPALRDCDLVSTQGSGSPTWERAD